LSKSRRATGLGIRKTRVTLVWHPPYTLVSYTTLSRRGDIKRSLASSISATPYDPAAAADVTSIAAVLRGTVAATSRPRRLEQMAGGK
jgi:hypothetical protein